MLRSRYAPLALVLAVLLMAGCAGSKEAAMDAAEAAEAAKPAHPLAGAWDWSVDTPQGVYTGILTFAETDEMLGGTIASAEAPEQAAQLTEVMFDSDMSKVTFKYDSGDFGIMNVTLTLDGDAMDGLMNVTQYGMDVPMTCKRKAMME